MKKFIFLLQIGVGLFWTKNTIAAVSKMTRVLPQTGDVLNKVTEYIAIIMGNFVKDDRISEPLLPVPVLALDGDPPSNIETWGVPSAADFKIPVTQTPAEDRDMKGGKGGKGGKAGKGGQGWWDMGTITPPRCCAQTQPNLVVRMNYLPMPTLPPPKKKDPSYSIPNYGYQNSYPQQRRR